MIISSRRNLYPNVDFYSGIIYRALGIPTSMFTVMFAIGRSVGWTAHWREMIANPAGRIASRPRQLYTGPAQRDYVRHQKNANAPSLQKGVRALFEHLRKGL